MSMSKSFASLGSTKSEYCLSMEAKNDGMNMEERAYPTIKDYYEASSVDSDRPLTYQHGLSNYSTLQLGDERITFKKSLAKSTFTQEAIHSDNMSVLTDAHLRNKTKTPKTRHADYLSALEIVGEQNVLDMEQSVRDRMQDCTKNDPSLIRKAFHHFDRDHSGGIDIQEFDRALKIIGLDLKEIEVYALFGKYDADCEGYISYAHFKECVVNGHTPNRRFQSSGMIFDSKTDDDDYIDERTEEEKERDELHRIQERRIGEIFSEVDESGSGIIDAAGAAMLLDKMSGLVDAATKQCIMKVLADQDQITLQEFIDLWRSS